MSTARRRPSGVTRRPQVAGRPRTAAGASTDVEETAEGALAVDERTDTTRPRSRPAGEAETSASSRTRTVVRPGSRPADGAGDAPDDETGTASGADTAVVDPAVVDPAVVDPAVVDTAPADAPDRTTDDAPAVDAELPAAPAVRSGERDGTEPSGSGAMARARRIPLPQAPATRRGTAALLAVTILLVAAAGFFAVSWARLQFSGATSNTALTDVGTTATVSEQVNEAVTKVYSFDFARLDQAESDARGVITGPFVGQFDQIFGNVRQLAPKQRAVVTATIPKSAVQSIDGDDASVYVFVNQVVRRVDDAGRPQEGTAAARLRVDAEYVDGRWKIAGMTPA